ncbi:MAG TPA: PAS domain S-box protein [Terracidiphilus sp.]|nr:PAS domain S-box protein [Terracidiphilus sp.]
MSARALLDRASPAPARLWSTPRSKGHSVQFYEEDSYLLEDLTRFIGAAILAGDAALIITTEPHRKGLLARLGGRGLDLTRALDEGRFLALDAAETLTKFMLDGKPDPELFVEIASNLIARLALNESGETRRVAVFGEMVALLWADRQFEAAIELEQLWNQLGRTHSFQLHCAYPLDQFSKVEDGKKILEISSEHSHVVPTEQYTALAGDQERSQAVLILQQKAQALETEVQERKRVQQAFQDREMELRDFLENAVVGMHWVAADGTILWANKAELALLGYERSEYVGRHISEFHADIHVIDDILERLKRNEELHVYEARLKCKDGAIRYVQIDSNVLVRDGEFVHTRCFTTDITERKQSERALHRMAAIVESSDDAIISKDLNGVVTDWNKSAERIFGYEAAEIVGRPITVLIPAEFMNDENMILAKIRAGERIDHFQTVRLRKNGDRIDVSITISPIRDQRGSIVGAAKIVRDITAQKKLETKLHMSERLASVGRLAATVAHEINNPLEAVINFIHIAKEQCEASEEIKRYLNAADKELARVAHITQQTLGFYRDNSHPKPLVIADVLQDVLTVYERKCQYKALNVEQRIEPGLTLNTMQGELKQILSNLIANAIDASKRNGKIVICARTAHHFPSGGSGVRITIADDGVGISDENKEKLFAPFFTTKAAVGTGLGLWIVKDLLEKRGGRIRFRSSDSDRTGTVMTIYLPSA